MKINMKQGEEMTNILEYEACVWDHQKWSMAIGTEKNLLLAKKCNVKNGKIIG